MIRISVTSTEVRHQSGNAKATGKPYSLSFQTVWLHLVDRHGQPDPYPTKVEIILEKDKDGTALYNPVGDYQLSPSSLYVDRSGNVAISPRLVPLKAKTAAATA